MSKFCIRKEIEKRLPSNDIFTIALILSCCDYCKKIENDSNKDKYSKLFFEPLFICLKEDENALFKAMGSVILEDTASLFHESCNEADEIRKIVNALNESTKQKKNNILIDCLSNVSPCSYLKLMARLNYDQNDNIAFAMALCFLSAKIDICYMAFRIKFIVKDNNFVFFDIGTSLDEGCVEYHTQEIMKLSQEQYDKDAYYFEVELYKKIKKQFGMKKEEEGKIMFTNRGPIFLYEHCLNADKCSFYRLFQLSDNHNWREVYQLLKTLKKETNDGCIE